MTFAGSIDVERQVLLNPLMETTEPTNQAPVAATSDRSPRQLRPLVFVVGLVLVLAGLLWFANRRPALPEGVSEDDYQRAAAAYEKAFRRSPEHQEVIMLLGELAARDGRLQMAAACFAHIPADDPRYAASAEFQRAQVLMQQDRVAEAERLFRSFLARSENDDSIPAANVLQARKWVTFILSVELRFEERKPYLIDAHQQGQADVYDSEQLYFPTLLIWNSTVGRARLRDFLEVDPDNPTLLTAHGRYLVGEGQLAEARQILTTVYAVDPDNLHAAAALLLCLFEQDDRDSFADLIRELPQVSDSEPWLLTELRGQYSLQQQQWQQASQHFQRLLQRDPANPVCHMGLARAAAGLQQEEQRQQMQERVLLLSRIRVDLAGINAEAVTALRSVVEACRALGFTAAAEVFEQHVQAALASEPEGASR